MGIMFSQVIELNVGFWSWYKFTIRNNNNIFNLFYLTYQNRRLFNLDISNSTEVFWTVLKSFDESRIGEVMRRRKLIDV